MKKYILVFCVFVVAISCSSDGDGNSTNGNILGKWMFYKYYEKFYDEEDTGFFDHCPSNMDYIEHKNNGELIVKGHAHDDICENYIQEGNWTKSGNSLVHTINGIHGVEINSYEILVLNNSILKIREIDDDDDYEFIITLKRM